MGCAAVGVAELEEGFVECGRARLRVGGGMCSCADMAGGGGGGAAGRADIVAGEGLYTLSLANCPGGGSPRVNITYYVNIKSRDLPHNTHESSESHIHFAQV